MAIAGRTVRITGHTAARPGTEREHDIRTEKPMLWHALNVFAFRFLQGRMSNTVPIANMCILNEVGDDLALYDRIYIRFSICNAEIW